MSSSVHIIVVDDDIDLANIFSTFLQGLGYNTVSFTDPLLALEYFKQNSKKYTILITDLRMPCMSGIELANKIRQINNVIKIFLITAFMVDDLENHHEFKSAKIDKLIQKPIRLSILQKIISQTLETIN
jgi:CheY-like chemotaxis protein